MVNNASLLLPSWIHIKIFAARSFQKRQPFLAASTPFYPHPCLVDINFLFGSSTFTQHFTVNSAAKHQYNLNTHYH
jgi:hypothetical protein